MGAVRFAEPARLGVPVDQALRVAGRRSRLPAGRALIGGFLVAAAAVVTFTAYTRASTDHRLGYVVAAQPLQPGERITAADLTTAPMLLPTSLARTRAFRDPSELVGAVAVSAIAAGELVQASEVARVGPTLRQVSFSIDPARAVGGSLQPGETVAVLATYGSGADASTLVVVPSAQVVAVSQQGSGIGANGAESITLALLSPQDALGLVNAVNAGQVVLVRTDGAATPAQAYRVPPVSPGLGSSATSASPSAPSPTSAP
jgi:Flp pilus assembly protein CpaB